MTDTNHDPVRVGIAGLGRSGWGIHANALSKLDDHFSVVAVCDPDHSRQQEAKDRFGCTTYNNIDRLISDETIELVVVATPSHLHVSDTSKAMKAGKHVIVEKPMAVDLTGVNEMIAASEETGRLLTVNQNYRYHTDFLKIKEIVDAGVLGRIIQIRMTGDSFRRRWDWQTLKKYGGGDLNNKGAHTVDWAILFFDDPEPEIFCHMETTPLSAGDAESHIKILIKPNDGPLIDIEFANACAYPQDDWLFMGTKGTLICDRKTIRWKYFDPDEAPPLVLDENPTPDRSYNNEELLWVEQSYAPNTDFSRCMRPLYTDLYAAIRNGAPLAITPQSVRRQVAILERCRELSPI